MRAGATKIETLETGTVARKAQPFFNYESGEHSFFKPRAAFIQPQLTIGAANDSYEQEADAMADKAVHHIKDPSVSAPNIQKKCADCEEKDKMQRKEMGEKEEMPLMRKADGGGFTASPNLTSQLGSSKGGGSPLPDSTRQGMESAFDSDFSQVRVHTGTQAAAMSQGIQAHAFTHGSDVYFNNGQYSPNTEGGQRLLAHELTHVVQQGHSVIRRDDNANSSQVPNETSAYPEDIALFSTYLIRNGYIQQVSNLIPSAWRTMSQVELTAFLSNQYTEEQLRTMFLETYGARTAVKARFRKYSMISALVIGLIWARENIADGEWAQAGTKLGLMGGGTWLLNRLLYARDPAAVSIMAQKVGAFGRWFQGAARTNKLVNFLARDVSRALLLWDLKDFLMSGGYGGPNIPFDLIVEIDIDDPTTWSEPSQTALDMGFSIWYRQKTTATHIGGQYLGKVEGSVLTGIGHGLSAIDEAVMPRGRTLNPVTGFKALWRGENPFW